MNDTKKREKWLQELKALREELLAQKGDTSNIGNSIVHSKASKSYQKSSSGLASKMYEKDQGEAAKIRVVMLALLTFLFETIFVVGSYLLFRK